MTENKPIMIDGVNVSKCNNFDDGDCINPAETVLSCESAPFCLFKQLSRKTQECQQLINKNNRLEEELNTTKLLLEGKNNQYTAKTQECEELKHNYNAIKQCNDNNMQTLDGAIKEKHEIECELEKVKNRYKCYSCGTCNGKEDYYHLAGHHENAIKSLHNKHAELDQIKATNEQAEQKLEQIRKYFKNKDTSQTSLFNINCIEQEIIQIIDEVER